MIKDILINNISQGIAAEKYGIPKGNVSRWVAQAKARQAEFADYADEVEKEVKREKTDKPKPAAVPKEAQSPKTTTAQSMEKESKARENGEAEVKIDIDEVLKAYKWISEGFEILKTVGLAEISSLDLENLKGKVSGFAIAAKYFRG